MKQKFEKKSAYRKLTDKKMDCRVALLLAMTMCFVGQTSEAQAQTCIKTPTCADLGYAQSATDCTGKTILKCPLDTSKVYCPSDTETAKTYKIGDTFVDKNGIALGRVITITDGGKHGRIMNTSPFFINDYTQITKNCADKTTGGRDWYMSTIQDLSDHRIYGNKGLKFVQDGCHWTSQGCCDLNGSSGSPCWNNCYSCGYNAPQDFKEGWSVYCVTNF